MNKQKKNKVLRVASLALVLTLVTTCLLAYTLAKYTTSLSGYDTARVAMFDFGAEVGAVDETNLATGADVALATTAARLNIFDTDYINKGGVTTIESSGSDKVIAPGIFGNFYCLFSGISEVATRLTVTIEETDGNSGDTNIPLFYELNGKYYANDAAIALYGATELAAGDIYINISNTDTTTPAYTQITNYGGDLNDLATDFSAAYGSNGVIPPNTDLNDYSRLADIYWYWPFEVVEVGDATSNDYDVTDGTNYFRLLSDTYDTALGVAAVDTDNWVRLDISATLTQVD